MKDLEEFCYTTIKLETIDIENKLHSATGFFYKNDNNCHYIITNKHVVENIVSIRFLIHKCDPFSNPILGEDGKQGINYSWDENMKKNCLFHKDPNVDLCAIYADWLFKSPALSKGFFMKALSRKHIPTKEQVDILDAIEDVIMIGYPDGVIDFANNMPIFRKGITATQYKIDFAGKKEFVIDIPVLGGSSGSPVILYNYNKVITENNKIQIVKRLSLLGINRAGFYYAFGLDKTKKENTPIFSNLAIAIKSERILELFQ